MARETPEQRMARAKLALEMYHNHSSVRDVAEELGVSYGTAHTLIKLAANGQPVFRRRGTRANNVDRGEI